MGDAIVDLLPLTVGMILSPIPIIAVIVLLLTTRGTHRAEVFLAAWFLSSLIVPALIAQIPPATGPADTRRMVAGWTLTILGVLLLLSALLPLRGMASRQRGEPIKPPSWLSAIDELTLGKIALAAVALNVVNPVNLSMLLGAGAALGKHALPLGQDIGAAATFAAISSLGILVPLVIVLIPRLRDHFPLRSIREFLIQHNSAIQLVVSLLFGVLLLIKGIPLI